VLVPLEDYLSVMSVAFLRFAAVGLLLGIPALFVSQPDNIRTTALLLGLASVAAFAAVVGIARRRLGARPLFFGTLTVVAILVGVWLGYSEPPGVGAAVVPVCTAVVAVWAPQRWAAVCVLAGSTAYLVALLANGADDWFELWIPVVAFACIVLIELGAILGRVMRLSQAEREAAAEVRRLAAAEHDAREELARANEQLAQRVEEQGDRIAGLGRLRQFLSPQIADAVEADALVPHRGQIAVVFCDLRGFTRFSNSSEPEELLDVLEAYYAVVGGKLREYDATVGSFQGDGILAYFNDPVPCEDPAGRAVKMAMDLREPLDALCERWARRGYDLGYGMGIAFGYATLGTIGFEGRLDYTPLGSVVNMASRLGDEAGWGEILIDGRALHAIDGRVVVEGRQVELKGFSAAIPAYTVLAAPGL
jgi:class 3 adenylate cyclase